MRRPLTTLAATAAAAALALTVAACSNPNSSSTSSSSAATTTAATSADTSTSTSADTGSSSSAVAPSSETTASGSTTASSSTGGGAKASVDAVPKGTDTKKLSIGFFGFAKANSFAQATWAGIQEYAAANNADATFLDSNFDGPTQVNQLQDAVTSKRYDVAIVQANDGTAIAAPVKQALAAGITVVIEFTPVGGKFDTIDPQIPGTVTVIDPPTVNGVGLAKMALDACAAKNLTGAACKVNYFQGFANYPLDGARTDAAVAALKAGGATVYSNLVGGYTADSGRAAMQNLLQAHPDVNVVIGSSQALEGATPLAAGKDIQFVANGGSTQAFDFINKGTWYGTYDVPEKTEGAYAAALGLGKARGGDVPTATNACDLTAFNCLGTKSAIAGITADYSD